MWHYGMTQSQHCNSDSEADVVRASKWFEVFGGLFVII